MDQHKAVLKFLACLLCHLFRGEHMMLRHQAAATDPELRIIRTGHTTLNQFYARPDTARILPAAAGSANPFAKNRTSCHDAAIRFFQLTSQRGHLSRGSHAHRNE